MVQTATEHMHEHIHHVQRDLSAHMEECLEYRTAEISRQKAMEAGADVSAMRVEMVQHVRQNKAHVVQEAQKEVSAHKIYVEQTAGKIIEENKAAVVHEAQVLCANIQTHASAAVSQAQEAAHAATSSKDAAVQEGISKTMQAADELYYEIKKGELILENQRLAHERCEAEKKMLRDEYEKSFMARI